MSRLNLEGLDAVWVSESIETLTFFFTPGETKKDKKGNVSYAKKKEGNAVAPEQYLQVSRSEEVGKQILAFFLNEEKVAAFEFTSQGIDFIPTAKWSQPRMYICIPTDLTFEYIVAESVSGVFKQWLQSQRFENYLENQASDSTYTVDFVQLLLLLFAYLSNRDKVNDKGNVEIIQKGVDLEAVAHTYLGLLTKLHNSSPRAKKLFPIRPLLASSTVDSESVTPPVEKEAEETEPTVTPLPEENPPEISESVQEDEVVDVDVEPVSITPEVVDSVEEPTISEVVEEPQFAEPEKNQKPSRGKKQ